MTTDLQNKVPHRQKATYRKSFQVEVTRDTAISLDYFIKQELGYYNSLVEALAPRLRAFPHDILSIKDKERKLWEVCAEYAVDPRNFLAYPVEQWPAHLQTYHGYMYDQHGKQKLTENQLNILNIAAAPSRIHGNMRKHMATEMIKHMINQAEVLHASQQMDGLKAPIQILQVHTLDSKRHLQIESKLVKITYDAENGNSLIKTPYNKDPIVVTGVDITENRFNTMVIRTSHPLSSDKSWFVDLKDGKNAYFLELTDPGDRGRGRK